MNTRLLGPGASFPATNPPIPRPYRRYTIREHDIFDNPTCPDLPLFFYY